MGGAQRYPSIAFCREDGFRKLNPSYELSNSKKNFADSRPARFEQLSASTGRFAIAAAIIGNSLSDEKVWSARAGQNLCAMTGRRRLAEILPQPPVQRHQSF